MKGAWRFAPVVAVALAAGAAGLWFGRETRLPPVQPTPAGLEVAAQGDIAPAIRLPDLDGIPHGLDEWRGRPLLINYWASWCAPCVEEMPLLAAFAAAQSERPQGVRVVGIALDEPGPVREFLARVPVAYPILMETAGPGDSSVALGNRRGVLPYSVLLDADGRVVRTKLGPFTEAELERWARSAAR